MSDPPDGSANLVAFQISPELMARARRAVEEVREEPGDEARLEAFTEVVLALTDRGMDFYYLEPLRRAGAGPMVSSAARLGIAAAGRGIPAIVRRVISSLDEEQVVAIADFVDEILVPGREGG